MGPRMSPTIWHFRHAMDAKTKTCVSGSESGKSRSTSVSPRSVSASTPCMSLFHSATCVSRAHFSERKPSHCGPSEKSPAIEHVRASVRASRSMPQQFAVRFNMRLVPDATDPA